jgi:hypothetical protein
MAKPMEEQYSFDENHSSGQNFDNGWGDALKWEETPINVCNLSAAGNAIWPQNIMEVLTEDIQRFQVLKCNSIQTLGVYIPASPHNATQYMHELMILLSNFGGGASSIPMRGVYESQSGSLIWEYNFLVWAWIFPELMAEALRATLFFTARLKIELDREAILLEINRRPLIDRGLPIDRRAEL